MAKSRNKSDHPDRVSAARSLYVPPVIRELGTVGALTQAGSGTMVENSMVDMMTGAVICQPNVNRTMC